MSFVNTSEKRASFRKKRHFRIKKKIFGTLSRPRLFVFRSAKHIYAHLINDSVGKVILTVSTVSKSFSLSSTGNVQASFEVGKLLSKVLKDKGFSSIVFDKGGYRYHGRVKALADSLREEGIKF